MESFWDRRFAEEGFAYGVEPNRFLRHHLDEVEPGELLLPAEGEGRNAVWAASRGWKARAFDTSAVGRDKALSLARAQGVDICFELRSIADPLDDLRGRFDALGLIFVHVPSAFRGDVHRACAQCLRPGGILILEAFAKEQLGRGTGGPRDVDLLYSLEDLRGDFEHLDVMSLETCDVELHEGRYHRGVARVVRLVARA
jgi:SAM-dependent methyltransferase